MHTGKIHASDPLKVGIYDNPPKVFPDERNQPAELFVDIIEYVFDTLSDTFILVDKGKVIEIIGVGRDISEQKKSEQKLREILD